MAKDISLNEKRVSKSSIFSIIIFVIEVIMVILIAYALITYGTVEMEIADENMSPTLSVSDKIIVDKLSYKLGSVRRGDVVVVSEKSSDHTYYTVLRVVGLPGETVQIKDGYFYANGKKIKEKLAFEKMESEGVAREEIKLGKKEYFLLGDNRNNCLDSRESTVGNVKKADIIGKAFIRRKPFAFVNGIDKFTK
ncbi:MAG: signal peptidase I [Lachnospiraceae bacterium]|nr:signal peptidase I [Lachnospiraceae bacterium]